MKKILSLMLACVLALGLTTTAFAVEGPIRLELSKEATELTKIDGKNVYIVPEGTVVSAGIPAPTDDFLKDFYYFQAGKVNADGTVTRVATDGNSFTIPADGAIYQVVNGDDLMMVYGNAFFMCAAGSGTTEPEPTPDPKPEEKPSIPATGTAYTLEQTAELDGKEIAFDTYALKDANGNGTNYMKIRDLAYVLNGTNAQFALGYDAGSISFTSKTAYTPNGTEMAVPFTGDQTYNVTPGTFLVDGKEVEMTTISILDAAGNGYTYIKVRDLAQALNFYVGWNGKIVIDTNRPYEA